MKKNDLRQNIEYILIGQATIYCEQINTGAKPCAQLMFQTQYLTLIKNTIKKEKCKAIYFDEDQDFKVVFIYKYEFVKLIIDELLIKKSKKIIPNGFEVWAAGKLFGYSDFEISRYLKKHGYLNKSS
jgi:hypothetical protein